jgi:hypothetical protein
VSLQSRIEDKKLKQIPRRHQRKENVNNREKIKCSSEQKLNKLKQIPRRYQRKENVNNREDEMW